MQAQAANFPVVDRVTLLGAVDELTGAATVPVLLSRVPCGFPSPAEDHIDERLDLVRAASHGRSSGRCD